MNKMNSKMNKKNAIKKLLSICLILILICSLCACGKDQSANGQSATTTAGDQTTEQPKAAATESKDADTSAKTPFSVKYNCGNSWDNNGMRATQIDVMISNVSGRDANGWELDLTVPEGAKLEQGWNANIEIKGTNLHATPMDYTSLIASNAFVGFGLILDTPGDYQPETSKLTVDGKTYEMKGLGQVVYNNNEELDNEEPDKKEDAQATESEADDTKDADDSKTSSAKKEDNPVVAHGKLSVKGTKIVDRDDKEFQLKGVSTHGIAWFPEYLNKEAFASLKDNFGVNMIRLAMYSNPADGYNKGLHKKVKEAVDIASDLGMYVIIDWHILNDNNPNMYKKEATAFFEEMSKAYKDYENVIYEICNEPNGGTTWDNDVKPYAEDMIKTIRKNAKDAIIIVGTPTWCQDVDVVAKNPIKGQENIMYACHFYAATHKDDIRNKVNTALSSGLPIFISEFSICDASGNGALDKDSAKTWFKIIKDNKLSCAAWNLSNKNESSSILKPDCSKKGGFTKDDLSEAGAWILNQYGKY